MAVHEQDVAAAGRVVELISTQKVSFFFDFSPILGQVLDACEKSKGDIGALQKVIGLDAPDTYYFTGGGSVLSAIEKGTPYGLSPVKALMG